MKANVAFYWCASCGGCEEAVLDLGEDLLGVLDAVNIVFWPVALDFKERHLAAMDDGSIDIAFVNGAVRTSEQLHMARLVRNKAKVVVAFGICAQAGGIPGLANLTTAKAILEEAYGDAAPQRESKVNGHTLRLPALFDVVLPLDDVIPVDYYVPGCPPSRKIIADAFRALLSDTPPPPGAVLAPDRGMCEECPRRDTRPEEMSLERFMRVHEMQIDGEKCMLAQGLPCLGPATRAGCGARCINGNMPCSGCFGATSHVRDFGGKGISLLASVVSADDEGAADRALAGIADPAGTFYRYSLAGAFLNRKRGA